MVDQVIFPEGNDGGNGSYDGSAGHGGGGGGAGVGADVDPSGAGNGSGAGGNGGSGSTNDFETGSNITYDGGMVVGVLHPEELVDLVVEEMEIILVPELCKRPMVSVEARVAVVMVTPTEAAEVVMESSSLDTEV